MDYIAIVGIAVGIIGNITEFIGLRSLAFAKEIRNTVTSTKDSFIQQAQTINVNGMDEYAVIKECVK